MEWLHLLNRLEQFCHVNQRPSNGSISIPHVNPNLYLAYRTGTKGFDSSIFRNYIGYVLRNVYPIPEQLIPPTYIPNSIGNQFPIMVKLVINNDRQPIQQLVATLVPTTV